MRKIISLIKRFLVFASFFFVIIVACTAVRPTSEALPIDTIPSQTLTSIATISPTALPSIPTIEPLENCTEVNSIQAFQGEGVLLLKSIDDNHLILEGLLANQNFVLGKTLYSYSVSQDYKKLAYIDKNQAELIVVSSDGYKIHTFPASKDWVGSIEWLPQDKLLIEQNPWNPDDVYTLRTVDPYTPSSIIVLDLNTGTFEQLLPNYPSAIPTTYWGPSWFAGTISLPDPTLRSTLYAASTEEGSSLVLWDLTIQKEITRVYIDGNAWGSLPLWSDNGDYVMIAAAPRFTNDNGKEIINIDDNLPYVGGKDLFLLKRNGDLQRLTLFTTRYQVAEYGYSFSPDEKRIAFWLDINYAQMEEDWKLAIFDTLSRKTTVYCVAGGRTPYPHAPIWSPSGDQLMLTIEDSHNQTPTKIVLVDLSKNQVFNYGENVVGMGWLLENK